MVRRKARRLAKLGTAAILLFSLVFADGLAAGIRLPEEVDVDIEDSVRSGLEFLTRTQSANGSWSRDGSSTSYPTAMTALAGMSFLAAGSTATRGPHSPAIRKATDFLLRVAQPNGLIATPTEEGRSMHGHGFAMLFLAEVHGNEEDERRQRWIHEVLTRAVHITERSQSRAGGWLYTPDQEADEGSVTVTQIQGLRACRNAGIYVNRTTIRRAIRYIEQSANPDGGIRYNLTSSWGSRPAITAAAVATLYNAGEYDSPLALKCLSYCDRTISIGHSRGHYYYAHLYLAQAKFQRGGREWRKYYREISRQLMNVQSHDGSWVGDWVGATYGTAIAVTILQLPYRFVSIYQR